MHEYNFYNLTDRNQFSNLKTSEKILWCLKNDIFYYAFKRRISFIEFNCVDFRNINLSHFDNEEFSLNKNYKYNDDVITRNPMFEDEIFEKICDYFRVRIHEPYDQLKHKLNLYITKEQKLNFLITEIDKLNVFDLNFLDIGYWGTEEKLNIGPEFKYNLSQETSDLQLGWITGLYSSGYSKFDLIEKPFFQKFEKEYLVYLLYDFCIWQINLLKEPNNSPRKVNEKSTKLTPLQQIAFIEQIRNRIPNFQSLSLETKTYILDQFTNEDYNDGQIKINYLQDLITLKIDDYENLMDNASEFARQISRISNSSVDNLRKAIKMYNAKIVIEGPNKILSKKEIENNNKARESMRKSKSADDIVSAFFNDIG